MKYISQLFIILVVGFIAELLNYVIPAPVPSCIYGIVIMFALLVSGAVRLDKVRETAKFLVEVQPIMFIPSAVGLILIWNEVKSSVAKYALACFISTIMVMAAAGLVTQFVIRKSGKGDSKNVSQ